MGMASASLQTLVNHKPLQVILKSMANTSTGGKNNADGVPRAIRVCPFCGKMGHTTIRSSSCAHNPKVIAATQDHVTSVASSTQEVPPLLPPAAQPAPPVATNDA
eukprot:scaffold26814_cov35-Attheya_sp.AAC.1